MRQLIIITTVLALCSCAQITNTLGLTNEQPLAQPKKLVKINNPHFKVETLWSKKELGYAQASDAVNLKPYRNNDSIFLVNPRGYLVKAQLKTGKQVWEKYLKKNITGAIGGNDSILVLGDEQGKVYAFKQDDGQLLWSTDVGSEMLSVPAVSKEHVVLNLESNQIVTLDATTGKRIWQNETKAMPFEIHLRGESSPVINGDVVYIGNAEGQLNAFNLKSGTRIWQSQVAYQRGSTELSHMVDVVNQPLVDQQYVYGAAYRGQLAAFDKATGKTLWSTPVSTVKNVSVNQQMVAVTSDKGHVLAYDKVTGKKLWEQSQLAFREVSAPLIHQNYVLVGDLDGYVHFLSTKNGKILTRKKLLREPVINQPIWHNDAFYVTGDRGEMASFKLKQTLN